jgi:hypothetical protein
MTDEQRNGISMERRDAQLSRSLRHVLQALDARYGHSDIVQQLGDIGDQPPDTDPPTASEPR